MNIRFVIIEDGNFPETGEAGVTYLNKIEKKFYIFADNRWILYKMIGM